MLRPVSSFLLDDGLARSLPNDLPGAAIAEPRPPLARSTAPLRPGLNFVSLDYLGLAAHPDVRAAALATLGQYRPGAAGQMGHIGEAAPVLELETRLARFVGLPAAVAYSSGADAIRATLLGVLRAGDEVIVDMGAHPAMFAAVTAAQARLHRCPAGSADAVERRLSRLSRQRGGGRLFLALPMVSAYGSQMPDMVELLAMAHQHGSKVIADVTHDLGAIGQAGGGLLEIQGVQGRADVVVGSLARCFGAAGGFAAVRDPDLRPLLRPARWRLTALSAVNASAILASLDLIEGAEGRRRRLRLHGSSLRLRNHLMADGLRIMGQASHLVPVRLPMETARARTGLLQSAGPQVTLLQAPLVAKHAPRWRVQLNAEHSAADIDDLAELIRDVTKAFDRRPLPHRARQLTQDRPISRLT